MKTRCNNPKYECFSSYGGRGIKVCDEWLNDFQTFHDWAMSNGYKEGLTIDRIDVNGNYEPSNCRWATVADQNRNKRNSIFVEFESQRHSLVEWSRITGIKYQTLVYRYKVGKTPAEILKI